MQSPSQDGKSEASGHNAIGEGPSHLELTSSQGNQRSIAAASTRSDNTEDDALPAQHNDDLQARTPPSVPTNTAREAEPSSSLASDDDVVGATRKKRTFRRSAVSPRRKSPEQIARPQGRSPSAPDDNLDSDDVPLRKKAPARRRRSSSAVANSENELPTASVVDVPSDDDDIPLVRKKRVRKTSAAKKRLKNLLSDQAHDEPQAPALLALDAVASEHNPITRNVSRWNQAIGPEGFSISLRRRVRPTKMTGRVSYMRELLRAPVVDDRKLSVKSIKLTKKKWQYMIQNDNQPQQPAIKVNGQFYNQNFLPTQDMAERVGTQLCRYLERLPTPLSAAQAGPSKPTAMSGLLQVAVVADIYQNTDWTSQVCQDGTTPSGFHTVHVQGKRVTGDTPIITNKDAQGAYKEQNLNISIRPDQIDMNVDVPESETDLAVFWPKILDKTDLDKKKIPDNQHATHIRAAQIVRYAQKELYGAMGLWADISKLRDDLLRPFVLEQHRANASGIEIFKFRGSYENKKLLFYSLVPANREFVLVPSDSLAADVEGALPRIRIKTGSRTRVAFVIQTLHSVWYATGDILLAWRTACDVADRVCASLITSDEIKMQYCQCSDHEERQTTTHVCQFCLNEDTCANLQLNDQRNLICSNCSNNVARSDDFGSTPGEKVRFRVYCVVYSDKSISKADRKDIVEAIFAELGKYRTSDDKWRDFWADVERDEYIESGRAKAPHALALSVDAKLPLSPLDGKVLYHANPANICLTATYLNRLKGLFFPVLLGYMHLIEEMRTQSSDRDYNAIIDQLDHFYVKSRSYKFLKKTERGNMDPETAQTIIDQMKQPVARQSEANSAFEVPRLCTGHLLVAEGWSPAEKAAIDAIIGQAEHKYSKKILRASDGSPWIWIPHHMPTDWSWYSLWYLMAGRFYRMRTVCNSKWETIDNTMTLFLECVLQYFKFDGKDEFFGVPMTIYEKHALLFSIGHRQHGKQMRTGFKTLHPRSLEDYDEGLSNICFETHLANHVKWDHQEHEYEIIHRDLLKVHLQTEHYSVPNDCPRFDFKQIFARGTTPVAKYDTEEVVEESDDSDNDWIHDENEKETEG